MDLEMKLQDLPSRARKMRSSTKAFFRKIKRRKPGNLDSRVHALHNEVFEQVDCLDCANCCKTISPVFKNRDIDRLAKEFKMSSTDFMDRYLRMDEEGDHVLRSAPCPFLREDNKCSVYHARPDACRSYPHTGRRKFHQLLYITEKNLSVCPAAFHIIEKLKAEYQ